MGYELFALMRDDTIHMKNYAPPVAISAFDGAFAFLLSEEEREAEYTSAPQRAGNKLRKSHEDRAATIDRLTGE